jgi:ABC-type multidrug transport system ATPase subunit
MTVTDPHRRTVEPRQVAGPAVSLRAVTRVFDGLPAIIGITLDVSLGEVVWLRGPNGSGKSTLLRVVSTALSPTFGGGSVLGLDLQADRAQVRARTDLLGHQTRLYSDLSAAENLRFTCGLYGLDVGRVDAALDRVGLREVREVRVASFSHGMRQRLALARCLMRGSELVLLDEPYAGLDPVARGIVDDLLLDARRDGRTVLFASHEPPPAALVTRAVSLGNGRLLPEEAPRP